MRYAGTRRSEHNPLRSIPLYQSAYILRPVSVVAFLVQPPSVSLWPAPSAAELQRRELANAEAVLSEAVRVLVGARAMVEDARRKTTAPILVNGRQVGGGLPIAPERVRQRKAQARRMLSKRLAAMAVARGRVEAARAALGMPSLVEVEERAAKAAADEAARVAFKAQGILSGEGR